MGLLKGLLGNSVNPSTLFTHVHNCKPYETKGYLIIPRFSTIYLGMKQDTINLDYLDNCPVGEAKPWLRSVLITVGWLCVAMGAIGVVTPGLPTTIFLIMAAWAFARSSRRFHAWLYGHKLFGPLVSNWENHRVIPVKAKILAVSMMTLSVIIVMAMFPENWLLPAIMAAVMMPAAIYIATRESQVPVKAS